MVRFLRAFWLWLALTLSLVLAAAPGAQAQQFPKLSGRVVDAANLLDPAREAAIDAKLAALEKQSGHQLVVATIPDLQGYEIADYGFRLGDHWGIGGKEDDDGALLIVAPNDRKVRIEVGYGLEGVLTDALSGRIIRDTIIPRFKENDFPGGIAAGVDRLVQILQLPPEEARALAEQAAQEEQGKQGHGEILFLILFIVFFFVLPMLLRGRRGRSYSRGVAPVVLWGPLIGGGSGGGGWSGGGGFSGGGGSFGGGGASGGW